MEFKQKKGLKRNTVDKFYTKSSVADLCIELVKTHVGVCWGDLVIEPSAGNGTFIPGIQSITDNCRFYDIEPEHGDIVKQDYLLLDEGITPFKNGGWGSEGGLTPFKNGGWGSEGGLTPFKNGGWGSERGLTPFKNGGWGSEGGLTPFKRHVIGNPPFGRQSSLAIQFIKKSCAFCDTLSFILPKSFKKHSLRKTFPRNFHLVCEIDLPEKSFLVDGVEHDVPAVFQIWVKRAEERPADDKLVPANFVFVKKHETPDISFRRVGVNAGAIDTEIEKKSIQSHYFIQFTNGKSVAENIHSLSDITFESDNTVGPKSISKQELILKFNPILDP